MVPVVLFLYLFFPLQWVAIGMLLNTIWTLYSNWSTDNGAASAAKAVMNTTPPTAQLEQEILAKKYDV